MTAERDNPRGPTSEQLRRRALAHEQARDAAAFSSWPALPALERQRIFLSPFRTIETPRTTPTGEPSRCGYCGATSPIGCGHTPCSYHSR